MKWLVCFSICLFTAMATAANSLVPMSWTDPRTGRVFSYFPDAGRKNYFQAFNFCVDQGLLPILSENPVDLAPMFRRLFKGGIAESLPKMVLNIAGVGEQNYQAFWTGTYFYRIGVAIPVLKNSDTQEVSEPFFPVEPKLPVVCEKGSQKVKKVGPWICRGKVKLKFGLVSDAFGQGPFEEEARTAIIADSWTADPAPDGDPDLQGVTCKDIDEMK